MEIQSISQPAAITQRGQFEDLLSCRLVKCILH